MYKIHKLKTLPCYFIEIWNGFKTFEIRENNDRGFQKGDYVLLYEYDVECPIYIERYTGRCIGAKIQYVTSYEQKSGYVVFSIKIEDKRENVKESEMLQVEKQYREMVDPNACTCDKCMGVEDDRKEK